MSAVRHLPNSAYYTVSVIAFHGTNRVTLRVPVAAYEGPERILRESRHHGHHEAWRRVAFVRASKVAYLSRLWFLEIAMNSTLTRICCHNLKSTFVASGLFSYRQSHIRIYW